MEKNKIQLIFVITKTNNMKIIIKHLNKIGTFTTDLCHIAAGMNKEKEYMIEIHAPETDEGNNGHTYIILNTTEAEHIIEGLNEALQEIYINQIKN